MGLAMEKKTLPLYSKNYSQPTAPTTGPTRTNRTPPHSKRIPPIQEQSQHYPPQEQSKQLPIQQETHPQTPQKSPPHTSRAPFPSPSLLSLSLSPLELFHHSQTVTRTQSEDRSPRTHLPTRTLKAGAELNRSRRLKTKIQFRQQWLCVLRTWGPSRISSSERHWSYC